MSTGATNAPSDDVVDQLYARFVEEGADVITVRSLQRVAASHGVDLEGKAEQMITLKQATPTNAHNGLDKGGFKRVVTGAWAINDGNKRTNRGGTALALKKKWAELIGRVRDVVYTSEDAVVGDLPAYAAAAGEHRVDAVAGADSGPVSPSAVADEHHVAAFAGNGDLEPYGGALVPPALRAQLAMQDQHMNIMQAYNVQSAHLALLEGQLQNAAAQNAFLREERDRVLGEREKMREDLERERAERRDEEAKQREKEAAQREEEMESLRIRTQLAVENEHLQRRVVDAEADLELANQETTRAKQEASKCEQRIQQIYLTLTPLMLGANMEHKHRQLTSGKTLLLLDSNEPIQLIEEATTVVVDDRAAQAELARKLAKEVSQKEADLQTLFVKTQQLEAQAQAAEVLRKQQEALKAAAERETTAAKLDKLMVERQKRVVEQQKVAAERATFRAKLDKLMVERQKRVVEQQKAAAERETTAAKLETFLQKRVMEQQKQQQQIVEWQNKILSPCFQFAFVNVLGGTVGIVAEEYWLAGHLQHFAVAMFPGMHAGTACVLTGMLSMSSAWIVGCGLWLGAKWVAKRWWRG